MSLLHDLRNELRFWIDLALPAACPWCGTLLPPGSDPADICAGCRNNLQPLPAGHCPRCAQPHGTRTTTSHHCEDCVRRPPSFSRVYAVGRHAGTLKDVIHRFKYRDNPGLNISLGRLLSESLASFPDAFLPDVIVPVPLHPRRLRRRGYQQALELAKPVAARLGAPLAVELLQRITETSPQQGKSAAERQRNLQGAFAVSRSLSGERVLLIDDVMTTASTARECAHTLVAQGASEVRVAVLGRA